MSFGLLNPSNPMPEEGSGGGLLSEDSKTGMTMMGSLISGSGAYFMSSSICGGKNI